MTRQQRIDKLRRMLDQCRSYAKKNSIELFAAFEADKGKIDMMGNCSPAFMAGMVSALFPKQQDDQGKEEPAPAV